MNCRSLLWVCVFSLTNTVFAQNQEFAIPMQKDVPVYEHQIRKLFEQPIFTVGRDLRLTVRNKAASAVLVEDKNGRVGWVAQELVTLITKSQVLRFQSATVERCFDSEDVVLVPGNPEAVEIPALLERSFAAEIKENVDRENIERQAN